MMSESHDNTNHMGGENIARLIADLGYKAKILEGDREVIGSAASGLNFVVVPYETGSLQFSLSVSNDQNVDLTDVNIFNRENRFAKLYIGLLKDGNELVLEADFTGPPSCPEDWIGDSFDRWERAIGALIRAIDRVEPKPTSGPKETERENSEEG